MEDKLWTETNTICLCIKQEPRHSTVTRESRHQQTDLTKYHIIDSPQLHLRDINRYRILDYSNLIMSIIRQTIHIYIIMRTTNRQTLLTNRMQFAHTLATTIIRCDRALYQTQIKIRPTVASE